MDNITADDIDNILATDLRRYARETRTLRALLVDVAATLRDLAQTNTQLHHDIDRIKATRRTQTTPLAVALDALNALSAEERAQVHSIEATALIDFLNSELASVRARQLAVASTARQLANSMRDVDVEKAEYIESLAHAGSVNTSELTIDYEPYRLATLDTLFDGENETVNEMVAQDPHQVDPAHLPVLAHSDAELEKVQPVHDDLSWLDDITSGEEPAEEHDDTRHDG